ncbi:RNA-directed DNA polymerase, eukaryota [Tanacetum coccineum]|uniref:RNA-directed DNA polymerase, eukaryota n=1 Tax=Tanacetum coccineum TaxID=301880 RepID=A0ABQ5J5Z4_9ASTR
MGDEVWKKVSYKKRRAGFDKSELPSIQNKPYMGKFRSKEDDLEKISVFVFINNIPDSCSAKELFNTCKQYGHVMDSFIPNKRSKAGKRFGFVKFINVFNEERLVDNLGTVWIVIELSPHVNVRLRAKLSSIPNLFTLLYKEGFPDIKVSYLGGMWVMLELGSVSTQHSLLLHTGVNSWFQILQPAVHDFVSEERVVWVDIEGVPLKFWSRETFVKIGKVFMARAKELFAWTPTFVEYKESEYISDDEGLQNSVHQPVGSEPVKEDLFDSDEDGVSDTIFEDNIVSPIKSVCHSSGKER